VKGILFKPDMVKAIAEGRKTATRRVMKPQPPDGLILACYIENSKVLDFVLADEHGDVVDEKCPQPRYRVGETVYVKEAWFWNNWVETGPELDAEERMGWLLYRLDGEAEEQFPEDYIGFRWNSPLFMPEWAARYFITITGVRTERLREITLDDCIAEGIKPYTFAKGCLSENPPDTRWQFAELWDTINPKYPWDSNPWVWVYEFRLKEGSHASTG